MRERDLPVARRRPTPKGAGYGRPPRASQFKPGHSGNPKGRPKGSKSLRRELERELGERIPIDGGDRRRKIPLRRLILKQLVRLAAKGDLKGIAMVMKEVGGAEEEEATAAVEQASFNREEDERVMLSMLTRIRAMEDPPQGAADDQPKPDDPSTPQKE